MNHLRYAGLPPERQRAIFTSIILADPALRDALHRTRDLHLPDWWIVSGVLYNRVWNHLTDRPALHGVRDLDIIYFDDGDLGWDAENAVIGRGAAIFRGFPQPVEIRNQARVHLWFKTRFGTDYTPLRCAAESIGRYAARAHCVGVRLDSDDRLVVHAPFGLDDIFSFRLAPNRAIDNRQTYENKARRARLYWPELTVRDWEDRG